MIANEKIGQTPAKFDNVIDNIFKVVYGIDFHKGKNLYLQHTNQHSSNQLGDVHFWCPLLLFHVKKIFL